MFIFDSRYTRAPFRAACRSFPRLRERFWNTVTLIEFGRLFICKLLVSGMGIQLGIDADIQKTGLTCNLALVLKVREDKALK